jgi:hypothetical protein
MNWGVAQAVERLLCKCKALSSSPVLQKKKKKKPTRRIKYQNFSQALVAHAYNPSYLGGEISRISI